MWARYLHVYSVYKYSNSECGLVAFRIYMEADNGFLIDYLRVSASPFNVVKIEYIYILCVCDVVVDCWDCTPPTPRRFSLFHQHAMAHSDGNYTRGPYNIDCREVFFCYVYVHSRSLKLVLREENAVGGKFLIPPLTRPFQTLKLGYILL